MSTTGLNAAKLRIELDTQEAQARLDNLEQKMKAVETAINFGEQEIKDQEAWSKDASRRRLSGLKPSRETTGPGKFGVRNIPGALTAENMAGIAAGLIPGTPPAIPAAVRMGVGLVDQYGAFGAGFAKGLVKNLGLPEPISEAMQRAIDMIDETGRKKLVEFDRQLKAFFPAFDKTIEMAKAHLVTGGHVNADQLSRFAATAYEWEFVQARKDKDIRDKTLKLIGEKAPGVMQEFFMRALQGKVSP